MSVSKARRGLDALLGRYPEAEVLRVDWQAVSPVRPEGPWVLVDLLGSAGKGWFAIWKHTGAVYEVDQWGAVGDDPLLVLPERRLSGQYVPLAMRIVDSLDTEVGGGAPVPETERVQALIGSRTLMVYVRAFDTAVRQAVLMTFGSSRGGTSLGRIELVDATAADMRLAEAIDDVGMVDLDGRNV